MASLLVESPRWRYRRKFGGIEVREGVYVIPYSFHNYRASVPGGHAKAVARPRFSF